MIQAGTTITTPHGESMVMVIEYHNGTGMAGYESGAVMVYTDARRSYSVWSVGKDETLRHPTEVTTPEAALNAFTVRSMDRLYSHFNLRVPSLTFDQIADDHQING